MTAAPVSSTAQPTATPGVIVNGRGLTRLHRRGGEVVAALDGADFTARIGEMVAVVGRSGSGKTTLLTLVGLLDRPTRGELEVLGRPTGRLSMAALARLRRGRIGYLFQDAGLIARSRVLDAVRLPMRYAGFSRADQVARARAALDDVGLADKARRRVEALSGGERQRVGLARALALGPPLLICDEPSAALDETTTRLVAARLRRHADAGGCVIAATHDPILRAACDRVVALSGGRVVDASASA